MRLFGNATLCIVGLILFSASFVFAGDNWKLEIKFYNYILRDNVKAVENILREHPDFAKKKIDYRNCAVFLAAKAGAFKTLKLLCDKGASPTVRDKKTGDTILHYMFTSGTTKNRDKILAYLINEKKLNIHSLNNNKLTPFLTLFGTVQCGVSEKSAEVLVPLFKKYHANLNAKDMNGNAALHYLSRIQRIGTPPEKTSMRNQKLAIVLLKYGANPNITDNYKRTPLIIFFLSAKKLPDDMKVEYVNCLLDYGANPNAKSKKSETALKLVPKNGKLYVLLRKKRKKKKPLK